MNGFAAAENGGECSLKVNMTAQLLYNVLTIVIGLAKGVEASHSRLKVPGGNWTIKAKLT